MADVETKTPILNQLKSYLAHHPDASADDGWNCIFGIGALAGQLLTTKEEREAFQETDEAKEIKEILRKLPKSGAPAKFVLRLPHSLHNALKLEAEREGVSLNTLCIAKLAASLASVVK